MLKRLGGQAPASNNPEPSTPPPAGVSRRNFLALIGWGSTSLFFAGVLGSLARFMWPNVTFEPSTSFKAGVAEQMKDGMTFIDNKKVFIWREGGTYYVVSAICTHLGCTVRWMPDASQYQCPCHGSYFAPDGKVISGPAPRGLDWLEVQLSADGQLVIDTEKKVPAGTKMKV